MRGSIREFVVVVATITAITAPAPAEVRYQFTSLGPLIAGSINEHGQVAGSTGAQSSDRHAGLWLPAPAYGLDSGLNDLGSLSVPTPWGDVRGAGVGDINDLGQITGSAGQGMRAMLWLPSPAYGRPAGWSRLDTREWEGYGSAINNAGQVTGHYHSGEAAYVWLPEARGDWPAGINLLRMPTPGWAFGYDINSAGQVVGYNFEQSGSRPFIQLPAPAFGRPTGIHYLPMFAGALEAIATSINDRGHVAGYATFFGPNGTTVARTFLWLPEDDPSTGRSAGLHDIGSPASGYFYITPGDINDQGYVVGSRNIEGTVSPFIWDPATGQLQDLNSLVDPSPGWSLVRASALNNAGQIVGWGRLNGVDQGFLLTVPEPAALSLLAVAAFAALRRRVNEGRWIAGARATTRGTCRGRKDSAARRTAQGGLVSG